VSRGIDEQFTRRMISPGTLLSLARRSTAFNRATSSRGLNGLAT